jgi:ribosomal protein L11 methyltransferase
MYSLLLLCPRSNKDIVIAELWECDTAGVTEEDAPGDLTSLRAFFEDTTDAAPLLERFSAYAPEIQPEEEADWQKDTEESWPVLEVGRRFFIVPDWNRTPTPEGRVRLVVHPGMAFGTGTHETTQLCIEAMEDHLRPGERVLDLGCGSGILSEAAGFLDAGLVAGCDIDPEAVAIALVTTGGRARLFNGSARAVRSDSIDLVVANINAETICNVSGDLRRLLRAGGRAVLSGFPHKHVSRVRASMQSQGLEELEIREKGDWACIVVSRAPIGG